MEPEQKEFCDAKKEDDGRDERKESPAENVLPNPCPSQPVYCMVADVWETESPMPQAVLLHSFEAERMKRRGERREGSKGSRRRGGPLGVRGSECGMQRRERGGVPQFCSRDEEGTVRRLFCYKSPRRTSPALFSTRTGNRRQTTSCKHLHNSSKLAFEHAGKKSIPSISAFPRLKQPPGTCLLSNSPCQHP